MDGSELLERLGRLTRTQRLALIGLVAVAVAAIFWVLVYQPAASEAARLASENQQLEVKKAQVQARAENREQFEREKAQLTAALKKALRELPNDREIPVLLKQISQEAKKVGLEIRRFQPLPEVKREYYAEVPVAIEVVGSYHEVAMFFDRLSKMDRIVYVQDIEMGSPEERGGKVLLKVTGRAVTFRFLTDEEIEASKKEARKGKRARRK